MSVFGERRDRKALGILTAALGPDQPVYQQVPAQFRTTMPRGGGTWHSGYAALSKQGLHAWAPRGGLFTMDWGTISRLDPHLKLNTCALSALGFDGTVLQMAPKTPSTDFLLRSVAAWSLLTPLTLTGGGVDLEFQPGAWELPALLVADGAWSGGREQLLTRVREAAHTLTAGISLAAIDEAARHVIPPAATDAAKWQFWHERAVRVVQCELGLTSERMDDADVVSTRGAYITEQGEGLNDVWLTLVDDVDLAMGEELWVIHFPSFDEMFRPSLGPHWVAMPLPRSKEGLPMAPEDIGPIAVTKYALDRVTFLGWADVTDGRGALLVGAASEPSGLVSTVTPLSSVTRYGIGGEFGWAEFRAELEFAHPINDLADGPLVTSASSGEAEVPVITVRASSDPADYDPDLVLAAAVSTFALALEGVHHAGGTTASERFYQLLTLKETLIALRRGTDPQETRWLTERFDAEFGIDQPAMNEMHLDPDPPVQIQQRVRDLRSALSAGFSTPVDRDQATDRARVALRGFWAPPPGTALTAAQDLVAFATALAMKAVSDVTADIPDDLAAARVDATARVTSDWVRRWSPSLEITLEA